MTRLEELMLMGLSEEQAIEIMDIAYKCNESPIALARLLIVHGKDASLENWRERAQEVTDYIKKHAE